MDNILQWLKMYEYAKKYYEEYGNLNIPYNFKTLDGINYDEDGVKLGTWINTQTASYKNNTLSQEKIELLELIGIEWKSNKNEEKWNRNYEYSRKYYEEYGNLNIPYNFKTLDGINYDQNGIRLGTWIERQRTLYKNNKLSRVKIDLLNNIKMVWNIRDKKIEDICNANNIDIDLNKDILDNILIYDLINKIEFLKYYNFNIVNEDGKLHDLFSIYSNNIRKINGISLDELIDDYYKAKNKTKKL